VFRGNAKIAELVGARLRTTLDAIGAAPSEELDTLLCKLDGARFKLDGARRAPSRYVSLSERLLRLDQGDG